MTTELNEILIYLKQNQKSDTHKRTQFSMRLELMIPSSQLGEYIKHLSKDGHIHTFMHIHGSHRNLSSISAEKNISYGLSSRGKEFIKRGGYQLDIRQNTNVNRARA